MIGIRLQELRCGSGLSQEALARLTGISQAQVCRVENGERYPSLRYILRVCRVLQMFPNEVLFDELMGIDMPVDSRRHRGCFALPAMKR